METSEANRNVPAARARPPGADHLKVVEWSETDGCFVGSAPPVVGRCCHGDEEADVYRQLGAIVEEWSAILEGEGTPSPLP